MRKREIFERIQCLRKLQDLVIIRHLRAKPGDKDFWFSGIVDELNGYQKQITVVGARR